jgi:hypothetical protein
MISEAIIIAAVVAAVALYLKYRPTRAQAWYTVSAWAHANGDAATERARRRRDYLREVPNE